MGSTVKDDNGSPNRDVRAIGRRRRQPPFKILRTRLQTLLQPRRERAASHKLFLQSRRQMVFLGKPRRKAAPVFVIPSANSFKVASLLEFTLVVILPRLTVPPPLPLSTAL